jgi:hypothetical protein
MRESSLRTGEIKRGASQFVLFIKYYYGDQIKDEMGREEYV